MEQYKFGSSTRLRGRLLTDYEEPLMESLAVLARLVDFPEIAPALARCIESKTEFEIGYILLRPHSGRGRDLPEHVDLSAFDNQFTSGGFDLKLHEDGLEIFASLTDRNGHQGKVNLGLNFVGNDPAVLRWEIQKLAAAISSHQSGGQQNSEQNRDLLLAKLIHQIRNPLATILISASQMSLKSNDKFDKDDRMLVDFINSEAERIEAFLSRYSKYVGAGKPELKESDSAELIALIKNLAEGRQTNNIGFSFTISDSLAGSQLLIDPDQISLAFTQILDNSLEAIDQNTGKIWISLKRAGSFAKIAFSDNGSGIRPELLRKVQEPFYSTKDGGSGLGLLIAERIARAHGGDMKIEATKPQGLTVVFSLPCK